MTPVEMAVCVAVLTDLSASGNPKFNIDTHAAIAANICAAANKEEMEPRILAAYILTENAHFDPFAERPAAMGVDRGLYQSNSYFQGMRPHYELVNHPYYATEIASEIIKENIAKEGKGWRAIAAYWNPTKARADDQRAIAYYNRWLANYVVVKKKFDDKTRYETSKDKQ